MVPFVWRFRAFAAFASILVLALHLASPSALADPPGQATATSRPAYAISALPGLGGEASRAFAINAKGDIVGHADDQQGRLRAVLWHNGNAIDLGTLGGDHATAQNITDSGLIVGRSTLAPGGGLDTMPTHAFVWENGQMTDLGTLGGDSSLALAANDAGQIVGYGTFEKQTRAFVMTPEPLTATPVAASCAGHEAWSTASTLAMAPLFDAIEATGLAQDANRSLTPAQWQELLDASKASVTMLDAISPPPAREEWHAAQRQLALVYGAFALAKLEDGNDAPGPSAATWIKAIVDLDRAIANAPVCMPPASE